jgi:aspartate carbamoyltransferase regulatory subunit
MKKALLILIVTFIVLSCDFEYANEKIIWNQGHSHYIHTINTSDGYVNVLIDGKEYLRFEGRVLLRGRFISDNEIKIISNIEPKKNRIKKCPIPIKFTIATRYADLVSDSLLYIFNDGFINKQVIREDKLWNQDGTHYIQAIFYSRDLSTCVLIDGIEYLKFESSAVLKGRWLNENEIKLVSNIEPEINRINECPIPIKYKVAERYADLVSDTLFYELLDPRIK